MGIEQNNGLGGVSSSYGRRETASSGFNTTLSYDDKLYIRSDGSLVGSSGERIGGGASSSASAVGKQRFVMNIGHDGTDTDTMFMLVKAPAQFDAVQIILQSDANSGANAYKIGIAPTAKVGNRWQPVTAENANIAFTPVTFGSTDPKNFRNPGGGAASKVINNGSATVLGSAQSDWITIKSIERSDVPGDGALLYVRVFGIGQPATANGAAKPGAVDGYGTIQSEFSAGYWSSDDFSQSLASRAPDDTDWFPSFEIKFLFRGAFVKSIGCAGDSIESGYNDAAAQPKWSANINGWPRQAVKQMNAAGQVTTYTDMTLAGATSAQFHEWAISSILAGGLTHLLFKPWTVNDGPTTIDEPLSRTAMILEMCAQYNVTPILIKHYGGPYIGSDARNKANAFIENAKLQGIGVFDPSPVLCDAAGEIKVEYLTRNAGGSIVDTEHLNQAGHEAVRDYFLSQSNQFGL